VTRTNAMQRHLPTYNGISVADAPTYCEICECGSEFDERCENEAKNSRNTKFIRKQKLQM